MVIREREAIRQGMTDMARALSLAVDREIGVAVGGEKMLWLRGTSSCASMSVSVTSIHCRMFIAVSRPKVT